MIKQMAAAFISLVAIAGAGLSASADDGDVTQTGSSCPGEGQSFEGYFGFWDMALFVDCALPYVYDFMTTAYAAPPLPANVYFIDRGTSGWSSCEDDDGSVSEYDALSFYYCPVDRAIYLGEETVWGFYEFNGDVGAMFGIAHEFAHHVQLVSGVLDLPEDQPTSIGQENQADCMAGAWLAHMSLQGLLELPDDMRDIDGVLNAVASAEGPERDHGTYDERRAAADQGYTGGLVSCNSFFPNLPVYIPA